MQYDANGNVLVGLDGKTMTYDAENRPLTVTHNGVTTAYVYGADGSRLKLIDYAGTGSETVTAYFGQVEIRKLGQGTSEDIVTYPHSDARLVNGVASYMHRDQLASVRLITNAAGNRSERMVYHPFGEQQAWVEDPLYTPEAHGYIGERYDTGAGLQYLNARYYDPELGLFLQPDWFDVTTPGVGTNQYAYSHNDPINLHDPGGNIPDNWATEEYTTPCTILAARIMIMVPGM